MGQRLEAERVVLVDAADRPIGTEAKLAAHRTGVLHRAFSVFVLDGAGRLLLQRRAADKYHSGGLWTNTCCGHPRPGEDVAAAAARRLEEEMGFRCDLGRAFSFIYRVGVGGGLTEHELDHVFIGHFDGDPCPDPGEVGRWVRLPLEEAGRAARRQPRRFTAWFPLALSRVLDRIAVPGGTPCASA